MRLTGLFLKNYLEEHEEAYPYEIWTALKEERRKSGNVFPSYESFYKNYISLAFKLGLIKKTREEDGYGPQRRQYYAIVPKEKDSDCWSHIQQCYQPMTALGEKDYHEMKEIAEEKDVPVEEIFIEEEKEDIKETADEIGISVDEIEERIRKSRPFEYLSEEEKE